MLGDDNRRASFAIYAIDLLSDGERRSDGAHRGALVWGPAPHRCRAPEVLVIFGIAVNLFGAIGFDRFGGVFSHNDGFSRTAATEDVSINRSRRLSGCAARPLRYSSLTWPALCALVVPRGRPPLARPGSVHDCTI